ncbi:MAG: hypothetical protein M3Z08_19760 [Chloroflexota bacterium]|nr:hypothetical protein [Chloroflexota bacterium]
MPYVEPGGDAVIVTPKDLQDKGALFSKASNDILNLETSLNTEATALINEMSTVLDQSPDAVQRFFDRWRTALLSLSDSYDSIGTNLMLVADGAQTWDITTTNQFDRFDGLPHGNGRVP